MQVVRCLGELQLRGRGLLSVNYDLTRQTNNHFVCCNGEIKLILGALCRVTLTCLS